jgi:hypothetical protein
MSILEENNHKSPHYQASSFIGRLHESGIIDVAAYLQLEKELLGQLETHGAELPKELVVHFGIITTLVLKYIVCHQDPNDGFVIRDASIIQLYNLMERMQQILACLSNGELPDEQSLPEIRDV